MNNKFFSIIKQLLHGANKISEIEKLVLSDRKSTKVTLGQLQKNINKQVERVENISDLEFQVFSQWGDDGIIQYLVSKINFPFKTFIEFGVENYIESNTRFLLVNNSWSGFVIDGSKENVDYIRNDSIYWTHDIIAEKCFITAENINETLQKSRFNKEVGILSVDIDGNDYWVWKAIKDIEPIVVISEYNSLFGFEHPYTIEYKKDFVRGKNFPFCYYGSSLLSLCDLATEKGYSLIGCNSAGNNAYFIRNDFKELLPIPIQTPESAYVYSCFSEALDGDGGLLKGLSKVEAINNIPVKNTRTGQIETINSSDIVKSLVRSKKVNRF